MTALFNDHFYFALLFFPLSVGYFYTIFSLFSPKNTLKNKDEGVHRTAMLFLRLSCYFVQPIRMNCENAYSRHVLLTLNDNLLLCIIERIIRIHKYTYYSLHYATFNRYGLTLSINALSTTR